MFTIGTAVFSESMPPEVERLKTLRDKKVEEIDNAYYARLRKLKRTYVSRGDLKSANYINLVDGTGDVWILKKHFDVGEYDFPIDESWLGSRLIVRLP